MDVHSEWVTADTAEDAVAHAQALTDQILDGASGVGMLSDEAENLVWSRRQDLPKPAMPGDP
ncbi:hypothetical protein [Methylobacterium crusticola]|nr:hypothetical protein [Methylobacterium crusticola]